MAVTYAGLPSCMQVRMPFGFFWSTAPNSTILVQSALNYLQVAMPVNYGTKFWSATIRPRYKPGMQVRCMARANHHHSLSIPVHCCRMHPLPQTQHCITRTA